MKSRLFKSIIIFTLSIFVFYKSNAQSPKWLWVRSMSGGSRILSIIVDPINSDNYTSGYLSGTVDFDPGPDSFNIISPGPVSMFVSKLDSSGKFIWAKAIGGIGAVVGINEIAIDKSTGDIYNTGSFSGTIDFDPGSSIFNLSSDDRSYSAFITKLDRYGNFIWAKVLKGADGITGRAIAIDPEFGDIYIGGDFSGIIDFDPGPNKFNLTSVKWKDIFISKFNSKGNFIWAKTIGVSATIYSIGIDPAGNVVTTGNFYGVADFDPNNGVFNLACVGSTDVFISKLDSGGNFVWAKSMEGTKNTNIGSSSMAIDRRSGDVYITGYFLGTVDFDPGASMFNLTTIGTINTFISKLDSAGNFVWAKAMGGSGGGYGYSVELDSKENGNVYLSGSFSGTIDFDSGSGIYYLSSSGENDAFLSKLDRSGNFVWAQTMGGEFSDVAFSVAIDAFDRVYLAGRFYSSSIFFDSTELMNLNSTDSTDSTSSIFIAKLDSDLQTSVNNFKQHQVNLYPNPASDKLSIEFNDDKAFDLGINMFNIVGDLVFTSSDKNIAHEKTIDISALPNAIYFIELNINGNRIMKKIVKQGR